jgi:SNARE associated Golgi protein
MVKELLMENAAGRPRSHGGPSKRTSRLCSFPYREHPSGLLRRHRFHSTAGLSPLGERAACVDTRSRGLEPGLDRRHMFRPETRPSMMTTDTDQAVGIARSTGNGPYQGGFARYGPLTAAFARFFNVLRQLNGVVAGTLEMDWWRFLLFNAIGCALWVLTWGLIGYYLGEHVSNIAKIAHGPGLLGAIIIAVLVIGAILYASRRERTGDS